ncbi:recombination mediator RecR [Chitinispirillales bacterium ANBcel5]|uniref:recombination mediator RecR n=1 Tax=Cellulosispirillum alkaliphilum TaxID=3039283 RepID=UPI002A54F375|nr:recombination mediator RecR [Chitinispirillales bacterium ANBcel5]
MVGSLEKLVEALSRLPTIGQKSAWRLAIHLLERPESEALHLAHTIEEVRKSIKRCEVCFNYTEKEICDLCSSPSRDGSVICVVEKPADLFTIEKAGRYKGLYHVLGGVLSPLNGVTAEKLNLAPLKKRIEQKTPKEIIIALGGSSDSETTAIYLARFLKSQDLRVTRLARGLPVGMELEYVDQITLAQALNERTDLDYGENR